jgi:hypothetical protein
VHLCLYARLGRPHSARHRAGPRHQSRSLRVREDQCPLAIPQWIVCVIASSKPHRCIAVAVEGTGTLKAVVAVVVVMVVGMGVKLRCVEVVVVVE